MTSGRPVGENSHISPHVMSTVRCIGTYTELELDLGGRVQMVRMSLCGHIPLTSHYVYYTTSTYVYRELNGILVYLSILLIHVQSVPNGLLVYLRILSVYRAS